MNSGDLSTDLGGLTPASAVRAVEGQAPNQDAPAKARRRPRTTEEENSEDVSPASEAGDQPAHQLDHLA